MDLMDLLLFQTNKHNEHTHTHTTYNTQEQEIIKQSEEI